MTLVEVLAVCVIIGILAAMTLPALTRAIGRGRLTACISNEYQVAYALLRYDEQFGRIPGWLNELSMPVASGTIACSWTMPLLPFLGRNDVYDMVLDKLNTNTWPGLPNEARIQLFVCPATPVTKSGSYPVHYASNVGASGTNVCDGVFVNSFSGSSARSLGDIADADGTTTTLAFAEKAAIDVTPNAWIYWTTAAAAPLVATFGSGTSFPPVIGVATPPGPIFPVINSGTAFAPSSVHQGGVVVAFCDGHTAFLSDKLQAYEYAQLLTPKSRWSGSVNKTNSTAMQPWLLRNGQPYLLDEKVLKP